MRIHFDEAKKIFEIQTNNTTYLMGLAYDRYLAHAYYGSKLEDTDVQYLLRAPYETEFEKYWFNREKVEKMDSLCHEYSAGGLGDFRDTPLMIRTEGGYHACELVYDSYEIMDGKPALEGLPSTFPSEHGAAKTLEICLKDELLCLKVYLRYSAFEDSDAIIRSVKVVNEGKEKIYLERVLSTCLDMDNEAFSLYTLHGSWARERDITGRPVTEGKHIVASLRGETSHQNHPFMMLTTNGTSQTEGRVYAMNFVYSGNFIAETELNQHGYVRMSMGINPTGFEWVLDPGAAFVTPEVVMVYSDTGLGHMTRTYHDLYRNHLIRSKYLHQKRPILINNWEATYFDFDDDKLVDIAREAHEVGIEMLVMDDGWFGKRNGDNCALGDWFVNEEKIRCGLKKLVERVNAEGLKFGIWFEPEMISPDSDLFREHPDYAIQVPGRTPAMSREQYVLDITRKEVRDCVYGRVKAILESANIEYVKWDMNRPLCDIGSYGLDREHMGEFYHRYVLGLYEMQERLLQDFPNLLLENCSGGGGRFDPGMLYYSPQIWTSDDMDPVMRLGIQEGTALIYPLSTMGAHICVCPNHTTGRVTPIETRANIAMAGTFGYELDITKVSEEDLEKMAACNKLYHRYNEIMREGDYYRIASYRETNYYDAFACVTKDKKECLMTFMNVLYRPNRQSIKLRLAGLAPDAKYRLEETDKVYSGDLLMKAGILVEPPMGDFFSKQYHFVME